LSLLLIHPPFGSILNVNMGIPCLSAYLRSRNISVSVLDANLEMYYRLSSPETLEKARDYAEERFIVLNEKSELRLREVLEYFFLGKSLFKIETFFDRALDLMSPNSMMDFQEAYPILRNAVDLISYLYFPEVVSLRGGLFSGQFDFYSPFDMYSTPSILRMAEESRLLPGFFEDIVLPALKQGSFKVAGISVGFPNQAIPAFCCAAVIKKHVPHIHVTVGGGFVSSWMRNIKNPDLFKILDSIVLDDGEIPLERLVMELSQTKPDLSRVPGLVYREGERIVKNNPVPPLDMESLPVPDYRVFPLERYPFAKEDGKLSLSYRLSRGCWWARCAFCRTEQPMVKHYQQPGVDYLFENLRSVIKETGVRHFLFGDESASPIVLEALCRRLLKERISVYWATNTKLDPRLTFERCQIFRLAGCMYLLSGLESCNDRLLDLINKGISMEVVNTILWNVKRAGLDTKLYMIVGFPTETEAEAEDSFQKVQRFLKFGSITSCTYSPFQIHVNSPISKNPEQFGIEEIYNHPDRDIDHPIEKFRGSGMSRETMCRLFYKFNRALSLEDHTKGVPEVRELSLRNQKVRLNYDPKEVQAMMDSLECELDSYSEVLEKDEYHLKPKFTNLSGVNKGDT
jgi:anaerobic magnesium-protoporphyrin IX monomethyl ester cyclase